MTALEDHVLSGFAERLRADGMPEAIVARLIEAYHAERLPNAETLARVIEELSGEPSA